MKPKPSEQNEANDRGNLHEGREAHQRRCVHPVVRFNPLKGLMRNETTFCAEFRWAISKLIIEISKSLSAIAQRNSAQNVVAFRINPFKGRRSWADRCSGSEAQQWPLEINNKNMKFDKKMSNNMKRNESDWKMMFRFCFTSVCIFCFRFISFRFWKR